MKSGVAFATEEDRVLLQTKRQTLNDYMFTVTREKHQKSLILLDPERVCRRYTDDSRGISIPTLESEEERLDQIPNIWHELLEKNNNWNS